MFASFLTRTFATFAATLALCNAALAHEHSHRQTHEYIAGTLHIQQPWSRPTVAAVPVGVVYVELKNGGEKMERLLSASTQVAERVELHTSVMEGEMMRMRPISAVEIAPMSTAELKPGGMHIMLMGLKQPLVQGQNFALDLVFERAGVVRVNVLVRDPVASARQQGGDHSGHHGHHKH